MKDLIRKALIEKTGDDDAGTFTAILSTSDIDRDGEIVSTGAFEPLPEHISIDVDHSKSVLGTVASGKPYYDADGNLMIDGSFASTAKGQEVRTLVNEGHITSLSVYFRHRDGELAQDGKTWIIKDGELLNAGFVVIPANPAATVVSSKQLDPKEGNASDPAEQRASDNPDLASALTTKSKHDLDMVRKGLENV